VTDRGPHTAPLRAERSVQPFGVCFYNATNFRSGTRAAIVTAARLPNAIRPGGVKARAVVRRNAAGNGYATFHVAPDCGGPHGAERGPRLPAHSKRRPLGAVLLSRQANPLVRCLLLLDTISAPVSHRHMGSQLADAARPQLERGRQAHDAGAAAGRVLFALPAYGSACEFHGAASTRLDGGIAKCTLAHRPQLAS